MYMHISNMQLLQTSHYIPFTHRDNLNVYIYMKEQSPQIAETLKSESRWWYTCQYQMLIRMHLDTYPLGIKHGLLEYPLVN